MIFFYIVFIFVISPLCLYLPDRIPTADSSENYSGQAGVLHFDNFYFPSENNTTVNINSMKSNVATFSSLFPRGERLKFLSDHEVRIRFQSTFPRGERQQLLINFIYNSCLYLCNYTNTSYSIQALTFTIPLLLCNY